jgi:hypothetical protein
MPRARKMWVVTVDDNGQELGDGQWVDVPEADSFTTDGFTHIEGYVTRLLQSSASFTSVDWRQQPEREHAIRQFFADRSLAAFQDYLAGNGDVADATRCLGYFLPADAQFITTLTKDLLRQIYGLREQDALDFTYEEHKAV